MKWFLLLAWAAMTAAGLGFVVRFGHNVPWGDEWEFVPVLTGHESAGPRWLWAQHNEHRLPLPRAIYLGFFRLTGDFRAGMVLQVFLLSALALGLMRYLAAVRGRPTWTDVFIPVGLLNWGHFENFLMGYQICFVLICVLVCGMAVAARSPRVYRAGLLVGGQLLLLEACGGSGLAFVPPVVVWLLVTARKVGRQQWKKGVDLAVLALALVGYAVVYFVGYERPPHHPPAKVANAGRAASIVGQYLSMGFGWGAVWVWPGVAAGVVGLTGWTAWRLVRGREWGVLAVLAGAIGLAAAVGVGRSGFDYPEMGLWSRYGLLAWPVLFIAYLTFTGASDANGRWVQPALAVTALALLPVNTVCGLDRGVAHDRWLTALAADARAGMSAPELVEKHLAESGQTERAVRGIPMLREAGVGPFGGAAMIGWLRRLFRRPPDPAAAAGLFRREREALLSAFLAAAQATGKPRGLTWESVEANGEPLLVEDRVAGQLVALAPVVVRFEPVPGSEMEEVPQAREPRPVTALFTFERGAWRTVGRAVFNLSPAQVVERGGGRYAAVSPRPTSR